MSSVISIENPKVEVKNLNFYYKKNLSPSLEDINIPIPDKKVTALIGPSGCGKTTLLRCLNRMHDLYPGIKYEGEIIMDDENILSKDTDLIILRSRVGMVFQKPTPFPMSIFENVAFGLRLMGINNKIDLKDRVEAAIKMAALWDEVGNRLHENAFSLSGGQQQRLVIARAIAVNPEVLLFDEPTSALDPISTAKIEELIIELKKKIAIVIVTHNMQQAARIGDYTAFMYLGKLIEFDKTETIFTNPGEKLTEDYITGRFG